MILQDFSRHSRLRSQKHELGLNSSLSRKREPSPRFTFSFEAVPTSERLSELEQKHKELRRKHQVLQGRVSRLEAAAPGNPSGSAGDVKGVTVESLGQFFELGREEKVTPAKQLPRKSQR